MGLGNLIQILLPKNDQFYRLFEESIQNIVDASQTMKQVVTVSAQDREQFVKQINDLEHVCDSITHNIYSELSSTFVTPFDREDIHELASVLDDIMDFIDESAGRLILYHVTECPPDMVKLTDILYQAAAELRHGVQLLRDLKKVEAFKKVLERVHEYENQADKIYERTIANLFENEKDPVNLIKLKDIYFSLERATDKCEDAANVLETIYLKHA